MNISSSTDIIPGKKCAFTICTKSYIGLAEALFASMRDAGSPFDTFIVVVDHDVSDVKSDVATILSGKIFYGYTDEEWIAQTFKYDVVEFCTSIKARSFLRFADQGYDSLVFFDPDILVFDDMQVILSALEDHEVVVTPHRLNMNSDIPSRGGLFNLGFLAVRNSVQTRNMLQWWDDRLVEHAFTDPARGLFTDQKWMDNLPLLIPPHQLAVMRHPGMNLAPWNLEEREIKLDGIEPFVRLRHTSDSWQKPSFVHYSAFNYRALAAGNITDKDRQVCSRSAGFESLVEQLMERLRNGRFFEFSEVPYEYDTYSNGAPIHPGHRRIYAQLAREGHEYNNPFDAAGPFFDALRSARMLSKASNRKLGSGRGQERAAGRVVKVLDLLSGVCLRTLGYDRYYLLGKLLTRYLHPVNHARLVGKKGGDSSIEYF
ncbi:hypothetical protein [Kordiimonas sp.]|uniref:hypothetical protein n=1 Tax=Kordiimonas sp. TaxID=1970157 RepID=UPI003A937E22